MNTEDGSGPSELDLLKNRARLIGVEFSNNIGLETLKERVNAKLAEVNNDTDGNASAKPIPVVDASKQTNALEIDETGEAEAQAEDFDADIEDIPVEEQADPIEQQPSLVQPPAGPAPVMPPIPPSRTAAENQVIKKITPIKPKNDIEPIVGGTGGGGFTAKPMTLAQSIRNEQMKLVRVRISNMDPKKADLPGEILTVANKFVGNVKIFVPYGEKTDDGWHIPYIIYKQLVGRKFLQIKTTKNPVTKQLQVTKRWVREFAIEVMEPLTVTEIKDLANQQAAAGSIDANVEQML